MLARVRKSSFASCLRGPWHAVQRSIINGAMSCWVTAGRSAAEAVEGHSIHALKSNTHHREVIRGIGLSLRQWLFPATLLYDK
jgi:hypothetical protein